MELTSPFFFFALAVLVVMHWSVPAKWRASLLLAGSYGFYALWDLRYLYVLIGSTALDFILGGLLNKATSTRKRKILLLSSLASNLGILFYFKYTNFLLSIISGAKIETSSFIPLGVSFYTFHSISYIVDIYRKKIPATKSLIDYAVYVSFFPKLISGPIERTENFLPQLKAPRSLSAQDFFKAMEFFLYGLFLKLCIGDRLNYIVSLAYNNIAGSSHSEILAAFYGYSLQIYADFFGYTLIARGAALLFGICISENFINPYFSASPQEFWRRWHVSLSSWFRDYVYIPLGGNRRSALLNIMITMVLAGLWHGADLKFMVWGVFHGLLVCAQHILNWPCGKEKGPAKILGTFLTFHLVSIGWIFFRAKNFAMAMAFAGRLFAPGNFGAVWSAPVIWFFLLLLSWVTMQALLWLLSRISIPDFRARLNFSLPARGFLLGIMLFIVTVLGASNAEPFVYFYF